MDALRRRELVHVGQVLLQEVVNLLAREIVELDAHAIRFVFLSITA